MDLGDWQGATTADWRRSMEALNRSTSYEHYLELLVELAADELTTEIESLLDDED
jgi:hypothetical protein